MKPQNFKNNLLPTSKIILIGLSAWLLIFILRSYIFANYGDYSLTKKTRDRIIESNKKILAEQEIMLKEQELMLKSLEKQNDVLDNTLEKLEKMKHSKNIENARLLNIMSQINESYTLKN